MRLPPFITKWLAKVCRRSCIRIRLISALSQAFHGGLGLGLAISKTIVEQHQGKITAQSEGLGKGSTFSVQLPLSELQEKFVPQISLKPKSEESSLEGLRILLVDDSLDNLALFSIWLNKSGVSIKTLDSATGVIEAMREFKPDILLSDISMPGKDGYALIAQVRALSALKGGEIPAGALTANARIDAQIPNHECRAKHRGRLSLSAPSRGLIRDLCSQNHSQREANDQDKSL